MPKKEAARRAVSQIEVSMSFVHRANVERYKRLLETPLSDEDRRLIESHMADAMRALEAN